MKGHFTKRGCTCGPNRCICGKTWSFVIDIGKDPKTGERQQKTKGGFKTKQEAEAAASAIITEVNQGAYVKESDILFKDFANVWLPAYID
ncbi:Arm DNA-binding domain-containing protein [Sporosarcina sp. resist]|uniref:Arm DNA-binding domain-containing protein n=1 Tax=Sporosarcina sp. resist TaxID=2762563 RepID=UPI0021027B75|nr:Arm DNA-binding domain-containing protein [Sporosarcina sp. resist]